MVLEGPRTPPKDRTCPIPIMEGVIVLDRGGHASLILIGEECFWALYARIRKLTAPIFPGLKRYACRPRIDFPLIDIPPVLVRFATVKARGLNPRDAIRKANRDHIVCDVGGVLLMMAERGQWFLRGGGAMWVRHRTHRRIPDRSKIEREQPPAPQPQIVKRGNLHEQIMWMLAVDNWLSEGCFSLLEQ